MDRRFFLNGIFLIVIYAISSIAFSADPTYILNHLDKAYPDSIQSISPNYLTWKDGKRMLIRKSFGPVNFISGLLNGTDSSIGSISAQDIDNDHYEPFFRKMYGNSPEEVKAKLTTIYWMPKVFGNKYPLLVTTVNGVDKKFERISAELEKLPPQFYKYLSNPAGTFYWRNVSHESYLSAHSFGIAFDLNSEYGTYWLWEYLKSNKKRLNQLNLTNRIPLEIVNIFKKEGFFWGGDWYFVDTMHFEYRPELFL
jgi:peptidoglycan L-alanyl-D-glutamate endopeptidase CwlK